MSVYMVDRKPIEMSPAQLDRMQQRAIEMSQRLTEDGRPVQYLRSVYIPSEAHCLSFFEASSAIYVQDVNEAAQIPFTSIVQVIDLAP